MTKLSKKPVYREVEIVCDYRSKALPRDKVIVSLNPNCTIGFRVKRSRREYVIPMATVYRMAVMIQVEADKKERAKARAAKRKGLV